MPSIDLAFGGVRDDPGGGLADFLAEAVHRRQRARHAFQQLDTIFRLLNDQILNRLATNAELVTRAVEIVERLGATVAGPDAVRARLGLTKRAPA